MDPKLFVPGPAFQKVLDPDPGCIYIGNIGRCHIWEAHDEREKNVGNQRQGAFEVKCD
jgi:hypothetical protein